MINKNLILDRLSRLREQVKRLKELSKLSQSEFLSDFTAVGSAERLLQISIEACLDIGSHIISTGGHRRPKDYKDIFTILGEEKILPLEFSQKIITMAQFRNRLVHLYWKISPDEVYGILQKNLSDFETFAQHIANFLEKDLTRNK